MKECTEYPLVTQIPYARAGRFLTALSRAETTGKPFQLMLIFPMAYSICLVTVEIIRIDQLSLLVLVPQSTVYFKPHILIFLVQKMTYHINVLCAGGDGAILW